MMLWRTVTIFLCLSSTSVGELVIYLTKYSENWDWEKVENVPQFHLSRFVDKAIAELDYQIIYSDDPIYPSYAFSKYDRVTEFGNFAEKLNGIPDTWIYANPEFFRRHLRYLSELESRNPMYTVDWHYDSVIERTYWEGKKHVNVETVREVFGPKFDVFPPIEYREAYRIDTEITKKWRERGDTLSERTYLTRMNNDAHIDPSFFYSQMDMGTGIFDHLIPEVVFDESAIYEIELASGQRIMATYAKGKFFNDDCEIILNQKLSRLTLTRKTPGEHYGLKGDWTTLNLLYYRITNVLGENLKELSESRDWCSSCDG